ncbi:LOW QUALITY PROTEIN: hypothetical protein PHMEG_00026917, partial [Phytophthora megakarya]
MKLMKSRTKVSTYLGVEVQQNENSIQIHQTRYFEEIIDKFHFNDAHPSRIPMETKLRLTVNDTDAGQHKKELGYGKSFPYRELIGSLIDLYSPDIAYAIGQLSRYVQQPTQQHIGAAKCVLRYLVGIKGMGIEYSVGKESQKTNPLVIDGFCDSDWGNDSDRRKSV